jgi:hypothetical protein
MVGMSSITDRDGNDHVYVAVSMFRIVAAPFCAIYIASRRFADLVRGLFEGPVNCVQTLLGMVDVRRLLSSPPGFVYYVPANGAKYVWYGVGMQINDVPDTPDVPRAGNSTALTTVGLHAPPLPHTYHGRSRRRRIPRTQTRWA